ncbi:NADPH-dependent FMN reductase [Streptomyces sp. NPDC047028]|uniref:NADPH-dependent FMN reductase n=1 Tax=Streptomyces sp. NPDC047028 TaxID=3155793 RepID=UPI00340C7F88
MPTILAVSGSPSVGSFTHEVLGVAADGLVAAGCRVETLVVRELPAAALLSGDTGDPELRDALRRVAAADAVVVATPVYKAAYSGLLKAFLDVLPQYALRGKPVLPLASGGSMAHALALDYGLRPVLASMRPAAITDAVFVPADTAHTDPVTGARRPGPAALERLDEAVAQLTALLAAPAPRVPLTVAA